MPRRKRGRDGARFLVDRLPKPTDPNCIEVTGTLVIPMSEIKFLFSRSGGPGGQHVNRRETQVELLFDIQDSPSLNVGQRTRLLSRLSAQIDHDGILHIVAHSQRSQYRNRQQALKRFARLLRRGLCQPKRRIATNPSGASVRRRLSAKKRRSERKKLRGRVSRGTDH